MATMLEGHVYTLPPGVRGFDTNTPLSPRTAQAFKDAQFDFAIRYCWRKSRNTWDLSAKEANAILDAGLALMVVQHVDPASERPERWHPTGRLGDEYGGTAGEHCQTIGIPPGINVWLDLEGVNLHTPKADVVEYCNRWHSQVAAFGYVPGIYVGFDPVLSGAELYNELRYTHYWGALNVDVSPKPRGYQMQQAERKLVDIPAGVGRDFAFDTNVVKLDGLRGLPIALTRAVDGLFADVESGSSSTA
jgi:hypothetical protein